MEYDVFISYSRKDSVIANRIHDALAADGITSFIDLEGISGGVDFPAILAEAIMNSRILLLVASENSYASEFTRKELTFAVTKKGSKFIFPLIIDKSTLPTDLEFLLSNINWRTLSSSYRIEKELLEEIHHKLDDPHAGETLQQRTQNKVMKLLAVAIALVLIVAIGFLGSNGYRSIKQKKHVEEVIQARTQCEAWLSDADIGLARNDSLVSRCEREKTFVEEKANISFAGESLKKVDSLWLKYREEDEFKALTPEITVRKESVKDREDKLYSYWYDNAMGMSGFLNNDVYKPLLRKYVDNALSIRPDDVEMLDLKSKLQ